MKLVQQKLITAEEMKSAELISFKIMESRFIDNTIATENIYLGCADRYAYLHNTNPGQGDKDEGLFARVHKDNIRFIAKQEKLHKNDLN